MKMHIAKKGCFLLLLMSTIANAQAPHWEIVPDKSKITFTGTQNNAPVTGEFKKFSGDINFSPEKLNESHVKMTVDMNSVGGSFQELASILKTLDWFNTEKYPVATFNSTEITKGSGDKSYLIKGDLMVRDKKNPITFDVSLDENSSTKMLLHGTTNIKRTAFGVGQGDWSDTADVRDDVKVDFTLDLKR